jgi:2-polyprenyl-3-methyl-5-hydroxy-6-metoxy-1,4-benzoquinol methylase
VDYELLILREENLVMLEEEIVRYYETECNEDSRLIRTQADSIEFLTTIKYIQSLSAPGACILDACAGTGIYAFQLAKMGHNITAGDLVEHNVEILHKKQSENPILRKIYAGSVLSLPMLDSESFDIVLNLGSYYHLRNHIDRVNSVKESMRLLKPGGYYFLSYINKYSNYVKFNKLMSIPVMNSSGL